MGNFQSVNEGREIVGIVWYSYRPDWYELVYADGDSERIPGTQVDAAELANAAGMTLVPTRDGTVRWDRKGN